MATIQSPMTIADYCAAINRHEMAINREYQRSDQVWPPAARSFLIETIILGYPLPKIFLFQKTDLKTKKTVKEVVDGQQRTQAIIDFFNNKLRISKKAEAEGVAGRIYEDLDPDNQARFLTYQLSIDLFVGATEAEIREAFRRLNSYTVPLNPEEKRHAEYQGAFKWLVLRASKEHELALLKMAVLSKKQVIRMQDAKLISEFAYLMLRGIATTKDKELTRLYKDFDKDFAQDDAIAKRYSEAVSFVQSLSEVHDTPLMKHFVFYTLLAAVSHRIAPVASLEGLPAFPLPYNFQRDVVVTNLGKLANAIDLGSEAVEYKEFVAACSSKTNVGTQKRERLRWLLAALGPELI